MIVFLLLHSLPTFRSASHGQAPLLQQANIFVSAFSCLGRSRFLKDRGWLSIESWAIDIWMNKFSFPGQDGLAFPGMIWSLIPIVPLKLSVIMSSSTGVEEETPGGWVTSSRTSHLVSMESAFEPRFVYRPRAYEPSHLVMCRSLWPHRL